MSQKVLLVEDELLVALLYSNFLERKGYEVLGPFMTAEEALPQLINNSFEFALIDVQLDGQLSGLDLAQELRKHSNCTIVIGTGNNPESTSQKVKNLENTHVLSKPIDFKELEKIIE